MVLLGATAVVAFADCSEPATSDASVDGADASGSDISTIDGGNTCLSTGTGQVRVMLQMAPGLNINPTDVWVAAMCQMGTEERAVRVVRADATGGVTTLSGLGPGSYIIRASGFVVQGVASSVLDLAAGATNITSLSLVPGVAALGVVHAAPAATDGGLDASGLDASESDTIAPPVDSGSTGQTFSTRIMRTGSTDILGMAEAVLQPRDSTSFDIVVRVTSMNCTQGCARIGLTGAEIRSTNHGDPLDYAITQFDLDAIAPGYVATTQRRTINGNLDSVDLGVAVAVYGAPVDADAGTSAHDH